MQCERPIEVVAERDLHQALVDGDPIASARIAERFLPLLKSHLKRRYPTLSNSELIDDAVTDAVLSYLKAPERFNPDKSRLLTYLKMSAGGDLLNALERQKISSSREILISDVEHIPELRNRTYETTPESSIDDSTSSERGDQAEMVREARDIIEDPLDRALLDLLLRGERRSTEFAKVLGIGDQDAKKIRAEVKRHKDRLKKQLQRSLAGKRASNRRL